MALCIEPTLQHKDLGATIVASVLVATLTPEVEPQPEPSKIKATLKGSMLMGGMTASVVRGSVRSTMAQASLRYSVVSGTLRSTAFVVSLTSPQHPQATLTAKKPIEPSLTLGQLVGGTLKGSSTGAYLTVSCPIEYITSCYSLGGWDNNLGWDDNKGWKD